MDLTGRPPVRRSTSGVLSIDAHGLRSTGLELNIGPADSRNPDDLLLLRHDRPVFPPATRYTHVLKAPDHEAATSAAQRLQFFSGQPSPYQEVLGREPCREAS